ncbi:MAG: hypothetical protein ACI37S_01320 [Candidatus Gastranaerophilaceae bacterium]
MKKFFKAGVLVGIMLYSLTPMNINCSYADTIINDDVLKISGDFYKDVTDSSGKGELGTVIFINKNSLSYTGNIIQKNMIISEGSVLSSVYINRLHITDGIENNGSLTISTSTSDTDIFGKGSLSISSDQLDFGSNSIIQDNLSISTNRAYGDGLMINADNLKIANDIDLTGSIVFTGGTNTNVINTKSSSSIVNIGDGKTPVVVSNEGVIGSETLVKTNATLNNMSETSFLGNTVTVNNSGVLNTIANTSVDKHINKFVSLQPDSTMNIFSNGTNENIIDYSIGGYGTLNISAPELLITNNVDVSYLNIVSDKDGNGSNVIFDNASYKINADKVLTIAENNSLSVLNGALNGDYYKSNTNRLVVNDGTLTLGNLPKNWLQENFYSNLQDSSGKGEKGTLAISGTVTLGDSNKITQNKLVINEGGNITNARVDNLNIGGGLIENNGTLTLMGFQDSVISTSIEGKGHLTLSSSYDMDFSNYSILQKTIDVNTSSYVGLIINADNLKVSDSIQNYGGITFIGGTNTNTINGSGTVNIGDGTTPTVVNNEGSMSNSLVKTNATLNNMSETSVLGSVTVNDGGILNTLANSSVKKYINSTAVLKTGSTMNIFSNGTEDNVLDYKISGSGSSYGAINVIAPKLTVTNQIVSDYLNVISDKDGNASHLIFDNRNNTAYIYNTVNIAENNTLTILNGGFNESSKAQVINDGTLIFNKTVYDRCLLATSDSSGNGEKGTIIVDGIHSFGDTSIIQKNLIVNEGAKLKSVPINQLHITDGIENNGSMIISLGNTTDTNIFGTGDLTTDTAWNLDYSNNSIIQNTLYNSTGSSSSSPVHSGLTINADNLKVANGITNTGRITFVGGTNTNNITGSGAVDIGDGTTPTVINNDGVINCSVATTVKANATLNNMSEASLLGKLTVNDGSVLNTIANSSVAKHINGTVALTTGSVMNIFSNGTNDNVIDYEISNSGALNISVPELIVTNRVSADDINIISDKDGNGSNITFESSARLAAKTITIAENNTLNLSEGLNFSSNNMVNDGTLILNSISASYLHPQDSLGKGEKGTIIINGNSSLGSSAINQKKLIINEGATLSSVYFDSLYITDGIENNGTMVLNAGSTVNNDITGTGKLDLSGWQVYKGINNSNNKLIEQSVILASKGLTSNADYLKASDYISGTVYLTGGTNTSKIINSYLYINGDVINQGDLSNNKNITISSGNKFTTDILNIASSGKITSSGTLHLYGDGAISSDNTISGTSENIIFGKEGSLSNILITDSSISSKNFTLENAIVSTTDNYLTGSGTLILKNDSVLDLHHNVSSSASIPLQTLIVDSSATDKSGIKFEIDFNDTTYKSHYFRITKLAQGALNLLGITLKNGFSGDEGTTKTFKFLQGSGDFSGFDIIGSVKSVCDNYIYEIKADDKTKGLLVATKLKQVSLADVITSTVAEAGAVTNFTMSSDIQKVDDLGTLTRVDSTQSRELSINGNSNSIIGNGTAKGFTINSGDTLNLSNIDNFSGFEYTINNSGNVNVENVNFKGNNIDIINDGTLTFSDVTSTLANGITGDGVTNFNVDFNLNDAKVTQDSISVAPNITLRVNHSENINTTSGIINDGYLIFNDGGINNNFISGTGSTCINGYLVNNNIIAQYIALGTSSYLYSNADLIQGVIVGSNATVELTGGTLNKDISISDSSLIISGEVTNNADIVSNNLTVDSKLTNNGSISFKELLSSEDILGTGTLKFSGSNLDLSSSDISITQNKFIIDTGSVTAKADQLKISDEIYKEKGSILNIIGGLKDPLTLFSDINGLGTTNFEGIVNNEALVTQETINNNGVLTSSLENLVASSIVNNGTLNISGGTINSNYISGKGILNVDGELSINNSASSYSGSVNFNENSVINMGSGISSFFTGASAVNMANGSTLNLNNGQIATTTMNNLYLNKGDTMNLYIDWKDVFNGDTNKILGNVVLSEINLSAVTASSSTSYTFTNLGDRVSVSDNVKFVTAPQQNAANFVKYDNLKGTLSASFSTLSDAINNATDTSLYSMKFNESADNSILTGKLIVNGNGSTIKDKGIQIGDKSPNVNLVLIDTDVKNVEVTTENSGAITVTGGNSLKIIADTKNVEMSGTSTSGTAVNPNVIYLNKDANGIASAEIVSNAGQKVVINDDIRSNDVSNKVVFTGNSIEFNGVFDPATASMDASELTRSGYDEAITWDLNGGVLKYTSDTTLYDPTYHTNPKLLNTINFYGGALDLRNGVASDILLNQIVVANDSSIYVDADLAAGKMDNFSSTPVIAKSMLHVAGINLVSDALTPVTKINFTSDKSLMNNVDYTGKQNISYSPIYKYLVDYDNATGDFTFTRFDNILPVIAGGGSSNQSNAYNPAVLSSSVAAQLGAYATSLDNFNQGFKAIDSLMDMSKSARIALRDRNKYAINEGTPIYRQGISKSVYFEPSVSFERVNLDNGPKVDNISYNSYVGGTSDLIELKKGWIAQYGAFVGYNGSNQHFDSVSINQSGGSLGLSSMFIKNNYFVGLTANVGASVGSASTNYGNEHFSMLMSGIALKTGYNFEFKNGKYIIQPSAMVGYSFANTFDYKNAAGLNIHSDPLHAITIQPGIKFIANLKNNWQPYASISMVWNLMDKSKFYANDVSLPSMSIAPYVQYGIGFQKVLKDRFSGYGQVMLRNGGRNSVALSFGLKWQLGRNQDKIKNKQRL